MKICFVCNEYPPEPHGGVGTFVQTIAHALSDRGHSISVVGLYPKIQSNTFYSDGDVKVYKLPRTNTNIRLSIFTGRLHLADFIHQLNQKEKFDIIEAPEGGGWSLFVRLDCPLVIRLHNTAPIFSKQQSIHNRGHLINLLEGLSIRRCSRVVGVSKFIFTAALRLYPFSHMKSRTQNVIYNGIDIELFTFYPYEKSIPGRIFLLEQSSR